MMHTYHHDFSQPGLSCVFSFDPEALAGANHNVTLTWSRQITPEERPRVFVEYLAFKAEIMQDAADRSGKTILDMVEAKPGRWVPFYYKPKAPPLNAPTDEVNP